MEPFSFRAVSVSRRKQLSETPCFPFSCLFQLQPSELFVGLWGAEGREEGNCRGADVWVGFESRVERRGSPWAPLAIPNRNSVALPG